MHKATRTPDCYLTWIYDSAVTIEWFICSVFGSEFAVSIFCCLLSPSHGRSFDCRNKLLLHLYVSGHIKSKSLVWRKLMFCFVYSLWYEYHVIINCFLIFDFIHFTYVNIVYESMWYTQYCLVFVSWFILMVFPY